MFVSLANFSYAQTKYYLFIQLFALSMGDKEVSASKNTLYKTRSKRSQQEILKDFYKDARTEYQPHQGILVFPEAPQLSYTPTNVHTSADLPPDQAHHTVAGYWSGIQSFSEDTASWMGLFHLTVTASADGILSGSGEAYAGRLNMSGTIETTSQGSVSAVVLYITCEDAELWFSGFYNSDKETITGDWNLDENAQVSSPRQSTLRSGAQSGQMSKDTDANTKKRFLMTRCPVDYVRYAKMTDAGSTSVARQRWIFAIEATRHQVSKKDPWRYALTRLAEHKLWVRLSIKLAWNGVLPAKEGDVFNKMKAEYHPAQARFFEEIADFLDSMSYARKRYTSLLTLQRIVAEMTAFASPQWSRLL